MISAPILAAIVAVFVVGAGLQRIAGLGLGLVVAPILTLMLGPATGVTLSNAAAVLTTVLVLGALRHDVDWPEVRRLAPLIVVGSGFGAVAVRLLNTAWLETLIGVSILGALALTFAADGRVQLRGRAVAMAAGSIGGFMNATAGVAGPAMAIYAVATRWEQRSFAATLQPILLTANLTALAGKGLVGSFPVNELVAWPIGIALVCAVPAGVVAGGFLKRWVDNRRARHVAIVIAGLGGIVTLIRG
ncbi:MAG: sulfite exporter TauE/SafE family protein, partial [Ornithinimicrobium sp.]